MKIQINLDSDVFLDREVLNAVGDKLASFVEVNEQCWDLSDLKGENTGGLDELDALRGELVRLGVNSPQQVIDLAEKLYGCASEHNTTEEADRFINENLTPEMEIVEDGYGHPSLKTDGGSPVSLAEPRTNTPVVTGTEDGPEPETAPVELDKTGLKWDARINSDPAKLTTKGVWRRRRGITDEDYNAVLKELSGAPDGVEMAPPRAIENIDGVVPRPPEATDEEFKAELKERFRLPPEAEVTLHPTDGTRLISPPVTVEIPKPPETPVIIGDTYKEIMGAAARKGMSFDDLVAYTRSVNASIDNALNLTDGELLRLKKLVDDA